MDDGAVSHALVPIPASPMPPVFDWSSTKQFDDSQTNIGPKHNNRQSSLPQRNDSNDLDVQREQRLVEGDVMVHPLHSANQVWLREDDGSKCDLGHLLWWCVTYQSWPEGSFLLSWHPFHGVVDIGMPV